MHHQAKLFPWWCFSSNFLFRDFSSSFAFLEMENLRLFSFTILWSSRAYFLWIFLVSASNSVNNFQFSLPLCYMLLTTIHMEVFPIKFFHVFQFIFRFRSYEGDNKYLGCKIKKKKKSNDKRLEKSYHAYMFYVLTFPPFSTIRANVFNSFTPSFILRPRVARKKVIKEPFFLSLPRYFKSLVDDFHEKLWSFSAVVVVYLTGRSSSIFIQNQLSAEMPHLGHLISQSGEW